SSGREVARHGSVLRFGAARPRSGRTGISKCGNTLQPGRFQWLPEPGTIATFVSWPGRSFRSRKRHAAPRGSSLNIYRVNRIGRRGVVGKGFVRPRTSFVLGGTVS